MDAALATPVVVVSFFAIFLPTWLMREDNDPAFALSRFGASFACGETFMPSARLHQSESQLPSSAEGPKLIVVTTFDPR
ncbi:hypothetical protein NKI39_12845 [Mesorhizobium sp. M0664]|uniref:hypothetical protein n=1 Tax=Mesorhizobium sp. M0664 TaxID=2956982 RepID=UPI00333CBEFA